jgi:hypothetical protein
MEPYLLEKEIWSDQDFENMSWHDNPIYAFCFDENYKLYLDIDYIFKWVLKGKHYKFWMAPCTLVFETVFDFAMEESAPYQLVILDITRSEPKPPKNEYYTDNNIIEYDWVIETLLGEISFSSTGFKQHVRAKPQINSQQKLSLAERGGISFDTKPGL